MRFCKFLVTVLLVCLACSSASAQEFKREVLFGAHTELTNEIAVKVQGGRIRVQRMWDGDVKGWRFNPQHEAITIGEPGVGNEPTSILRGTNVFKLVSPGVYGWNPLRNNSSTQEPLPPELTSYVQTARQNGMLSCFGGGYEQRIVKVPTGYKWGRISDHQWALYDLTGKLQSWGFGAVLVGQVLYDAQNRFRGYADHSGREVITFTRDASGRVEKIADYSGREVSYRYSPAGELIEAVNLDGNSTRYRYGGGLLTEKAEGSAGGASPELILTYKYDPTGRLTSVRDQENVGIQYQYDYDQKTRRFTRWMKDSGGKEEFSIFDSEEGLRRRDVSGKQHERYFYLCEDYIQMDRSNRVTFIDRDHSGRMLGVVRPDQSWIKYEYVDQVWDIGAGVQTLPWGIKQISTSGGRQVRHKRDKSGMLLETEEVQSNPRFWRFTYDQFGNRLTYRLLAGASPNDSFDYRGSWTYDTNGNAATYTDALQRTYTYTHTANGEVIQTTNPNSTVSAATLLPSGKLLSETDPVGFVISNSYDDRGFLESRTETYEAGKTATTSFQYDVRGRLIQETAPLSAVTAYRYDIVGNLLEVKDPENATQRYAYDEEYRLIEVTNGVGDKVRTEYYDTALPGEPEQFITPFTPVTRTVYPTMYEEVRRDLRGRVASRTVSGGGDTETTRYEYDDRDRMTKLIAPGGKELVYTYDDLSRLTSHMAPGWGTNVIEYRDDQRKVFYRDPEGGVYEQQFNVLGQLVGETRATGSAVSYEYDDVGNLTRYVNGNGQVLRYFYDAANRLVRREQYPTTSSTTSSKTLRWSYNLRGDQTGYSDPVTATTHALDPLGQVLSVSTNFGPFTKTYSYTYRGDGLPSSYTSPESETFTYYWDGAKRFQGMVIPNEGMITYGYATEWFSQPSWIQFPGGVKREISYDGLRRTLRILVNDSALNPVMDYKYNYQKPGSGWTQAASGAGSIIGTVLPDVSMVADLSNQGFEAFGFRNLPGPIFSSIETERGAYQYSFDAGERVTGQTYPNLPQESYQYDQIGRRTTVGEAWSYNPEGAVLSHPSTTYLYDTDGNRTQKIESGVTTRYSYDESGRMVRVESPPGTDILTAHYDALSRRVKKTSSTETNYFLYTPEGLAAAYDQSGVRKEQFVFEPGSFYGTAPLAFKAGVGRWSYYQTDHLGTPRYLTNQSGGMRWGAEYSLYGKSSTVAGSSISNPIRFPGQYEDTETGLHQNWWREYDSAVGGYRGRDPLRHLYNPADSFGYVFKKVVQALDPSGLAYFAKRRLGADPSSAPIYCLDGWPSDRGNVELLHEHLFFEDGKAPSDLGYGPGGLFSESEDQIPRYDCRSEYYDDCLMRQAVERVVPKPYCMTPIPGPTDKYNCQDWAEDVREEYARLAADPEAKARCDCRS